MDLREVAGKIRRDEFGRPSGVFALNKQKGETSHDLVDKVRRQLGTRKVGHAGALDTFATGLVVILVGKDTKLANKLIDLDKVYKARLLLGVSTDTQDPEGTVTAAGAVEALKKKDLEKIAAVLESFKGKQQQLVSVYSSVKVGGKKLRVLMRDQRYKPETITEGDAKTLVFKALNGGVKDFEVKVPRKEIEIYDIKLVGNGTVSELELNVDTQELPETLPYLDIEVHSSKGTYIRQLAEDIGGKLGHPAMLIELERLKVDDLTLEDALVISDLT
ncbi:MAG: hypothetical protein ACE5DX_04485 [Candidatus Dojkabacteria bacterium]